jgi:MFS family permease
MRSRAGHRRRLGTTFNRIWRGFALASCGDGFAQGAVPLVAVAIDPSPLAVSAVAAADVLPWLVVALPAGHFADRYPRGPVAAVANVARAAALAAGAFLLVTGRMKLGDLIAVVLLNAAGRAIYYSAYQAMVPAAVPRADLEHANGVLTSTEMATEHLAGPVAGSSLFAVSASIPFFADAAAMLASCFSYVRLRVKPEPSTSGPDSVWGGVRLLLADERLRILLFLITALSLLQGMEFGVLVLLATKQWGIRAGAYGVFLAIGAVGNLIGGLIAERQAKRFGSGRALIVFAVVSGTGYLIMAATHSWAVAGPAYALVGVAVIVITVIATTLRQRFTPDHLMGRVGGAWRGIVWGAAPVGALAAGSVATLWSLNMPLIVAGVLQIAVAIMFARPIVRIIKDEHVRVAPEDRRRHARNGKHKSKAAPGAGTPPASTGSVALETAPVTPVTPAPGRHVAPADRV